MSTATRRLAFAILPIALGAALANAADPRLQIVSGTSAMDTRRTVDLSSAQFDIATKALVATTRAGNIACNTSQTPGSGVLKLTLDGVSYPVRTSSLTGTLASPIEYSPSTVTFAMGLLGTPSIGDCVSTHTLTNNLKLQFTDQLQLPVAEKVYFDIPTRTFDIRVAEAVLCESYVTQNASSGLAIQLVNSNHPVFSAANAKLLPGFDEVEYLLNGAVLDTFAQTASGQRRVQCSVPGSARTESVPPGGTGGEEPGDGITIFGDGFEPEASAPGSGADVVVTLSIGTATSGTNRRQTTGIPGGTLQYTLRVVNEGDATANGVRLREFATGADAISLSGQPLPARILDGTGSTCTRIGTTGSCPSFTFPLSLNVASLPAGQGFEFTLNRTISPDASPGQRSQVGYAAFVDPASGAEINLSNNSIWLRADSISNQPPVISTVANQTMNEDGAALPVNFTVTDAEGDTLTVTASSTSTPAGVFPSSIPVTLISPNNYQVSLTPLPDQNGSATITLSATDGNSSPTTRTFTVTVNPINDAPTFDFSNTLGNESGTATVTAELGSGNCDAEFCEALAVDFLANLSPGPANESDQTVAPVTQLAGGLSYLPDGSCVAAPAEVGGVAPATFFAIGPGGKRLPYLTPNGQNYTLHALLTSVVGAVDCAIRVQDSGSGTAPNVNLSTPKTLRIRYEVPNLPPTLELLVTNSEASTNEDTPLSIQLIAEDPEEAALVFTVSSANADLFGGSFYSVAPVAPEITTHTHVLTLTPIQDANSEANGTSAITVRVSDGSKFTEETLTVTVNPINDAPTFNLSSTLSEESGVKVVVTTLGDPNCDAEYCEATASDFLTDLSPGPANESAQSVAPLTQTAGALTYLPDGSCSASPVEDGGVAPASFFAIGPGGKRLPYLTQSGNIYTLHASLTGTVGAVDCEIRVRDSGSGTAPNVNTSSAKTLRIRHQTPPPP